MKLVKFHQLLRRQSASGNRQIWASYLDLKLNGKNPYSKNKHSRRMKLAWKIHYMFTKWSILFCTWIKSYLDYVLQLNEINIDTQYARAFIRSKWTIFFSLFLVSYTILGLLTACNQYCRLSCPNASYIVVFLLPRRTHARTHSFSLSLYTHVSRACSLVFMYDNIRVQHKVTQ